MSPGFTLRTVTRNTVGSSVALIGDSVGNSIAGPATSEYRTLTDGSFAGSIIDVVDGRCTTNPACPGTSGVEVANALPFGLDLVVVELGYNDWPPSFAPTIDAMMAALQARRRASGDVGQHGRHPDRQFRRVGVRGKPMRRCPLPGRDGRT